MVWRLLKGADVFLEGFRPGVIKRLGFDYDSVAAREPRLLYLSISGFGQTGPLGSMQASSSSPQMISAGSVMAWISASSS